ncbi:integrase catalytic domain-containing protein [Trichonephila clavipes]|nr:integrase catalytic domain-containing protein [Trichonephila clavipes]
MRERDSFESFITALKTRFENKRLLTETHINAILEIEKLTSESARDIRSMTDILSKNIRALKLLCFEPLANELEPLTEVQGSTPPEHPYTFSNCREEKKAFYFRPQWFTSEGRQRAFPLSVGNLKMTLEEFLTTMTQIEGILNSRPITPLAEDIDDLEVLTLGDFFIGRPITSISEPNLLDKSENTLSQ